MRAHGAAALPHDRQAGKISEGLMDAIIRAVTFLSRAAGVFGALLIGLAVLVICDMVVERYILNLTTIWQIDVVTYCIVSATFISSAYVLMTRGHVNVEILPLRLGPRGRYWLALVTIVLAMAFCAVLFVLCTQYWYQAYSEGWRSNTVWRARLWIPYLSMPFGLGLLFLQYAVELACLVTGRALPFGLKPREDAEEFARAQAQQALGETP
jgi:TRAP-type C4-dicarboxylate transport system permease small subunit